MEGLGKGYNKYRKGEIILGEGRWKRELRQE
jgi:hypothetical protein